MRDIRKDIIDFEYKKRVSRILCKLIDKSSKFSTSPFYLYKNFYTLYLINYYFFLSCIFCKITFIDSPKSLISDNSSSEIHFETSAFK